MATFRAPAAQAAYIMKALQGHHLRSVGTVRNYEQGLTRVAEWTQRERLPGGLRAMTPELAIRYLEQRGQEVRERLPGPRACLDGDLTAVDQRRRDRAEQGFGRLVVEHAVNDEQHHRILEQIVVEGAEELGDEKRQEPALFQQRKGSGH